MQTLFSAIAAFQRTAWRPRAALTDAGLQESKFGGMPWLQAGETWPRCQHCAEPMPLFVQLQLDSLPDACRQMFGSGLLQLFYCTNHDPHCESECQSFFPFTGGKLVRIIDPDRAEAVLTCPEHVRHFPTKHIFGWDETTDYPGWEEGLELGLNLTDAQWEKLTTADFPKSGDKLGGWPLWIQGLEYPACPICQRRMQFLFQIDSNDHLTYQFGDAGCGHITQCPVHRTQVAFAWACS